MRYFWIDVGTACGLLTYDKNGKLVKEWTAPYFRKMFGGQDVRLKLKDLARAGKLKWQEL